MVMCARIYLHGITGTDERSSIRLCDWAVSDWLDDSVELSEDNGVGFGNCD